MIKPAQLEAVAGADPIPGHVAGHAVAQVSDPKRRRLIWFLHWFSHRPGGLRALALDLINRNLRTRLGSATMHRLGIEPATVYAGEPFEEICCELSFYPSESRRDLRQTIEFCLASNDFGGIAAAKKLLSPESRRASAATFLSECRDSACRGLAETLRQISSDPRAKWEVPYMQDLVGAVAEEMRGHADLARSLAAQTKIASHVSDALEFSYRTRGLVVVFGTERIGKSKAAEQWTAANPDKARIIPLTAGTTDLLFYSEVAEAIGCGAMNGLTAGEMRERIRGAVKSRDLMLIFDEAHCLFGLSPKASVKRLEYLRTEFVNNGIPVALIVTPQFANRLVGLERSTDFNLNQFRGRITKWVELPQKPSRADIESVACFRLPEIDNESLTLLVDSASASECPLAALHNAILEAQSLAEKVGSEITPDLVRQAVGFAMWTTDRLAATIPAPASKTPKRRSRTPAVDTSMAQLSPGDSLQAELPAGAGRLHPAGNRSSLPATSAETGEFDRRPELRPEAENSQRLATGYRVGGLVHESIP
jgi:hypothetical protein